MRFSRILFPTDFSNPCEQVAPSVSAMQEILCAHLTLLHSVEVPAIWFSQEALEEWREIDTSRERAHEKLQSFEARLFGDKHPDLVEDTGDAAAAILRCVEERQIDLVMMPTHGYGFLRRALLGSVTTKVLHDSPCAVWTASKEVPTAKTAYRRVLVGIENLRQDRELLRSAALLARDFRSELMIVHSYPDFAGTMIERYERPLPGRSEMAIRKKIDALQAAAGTSAPVVLARGEVNEVIAETARRQEIDLVIAGKGSYGGLLESIRSHLYYVVRSSPCPVLVLP